MSYLNGILVPFKLGIWHTVYNLSQAYIYIHIYIYIYISGFINVQQLLSPTEPFHVVMDILEDILGVWGGQKQKINIGVMHGYN